MASDVSLEDFEIVAAAAAHAASSLSTDPRLIARAVRDAVQDYRRHSLPLSGGGGGGEGGHACGEGQQSSNIQKNTRKQTNRLIGRITNRLKENQITHRVRNP